LLQISEYPQNLLKNSNKFLLTYQKETSQPYQGNVNFAIPIVFY